MELHEYMIDVAFVVNPCRTIVKDAAAAAGLTLGAMLPEGLPPLYADKRSVRQILLNLLSNAIKFTPDGGGVMVEARLERAGDISLIEIGRASCRERV